MRKGLTDYYSMVWLPFKEWLKMHWKGYLLFSVFYVVGCYIIGYGAGNFYDDYLKNKFCRKRRIES
jgi:hypothetical protein